MGRDRQGLWFGVAAYGIWGVAPAFWKLLSGVPALQQTAHRVVWSVPFLATAVMVSGRRARLRGVLGDRRALGVAAVGAVLLAVNWGVFVWAVAAGRIVEASLGYFINPLLSVALGVVVLGERLRPAGVAAVALAAAGVAYLTLMVGEVPWVSLVLAGSFALYGLLKKRPGAAPPLEGLLLETVLVSAPAVAFMVAVGVRSGEAFGAGPADAALLVAAGLVTAAPLVLFGAAAQRIPLSTVGLLQYLAPSLQLVLGVAVYGEALEAGRLVGFGLVWIALAVFTFDNLRAARAAGPGPVV